jgi:hypothetical protein
MVELVIRLLLWAPWSQVVLLGRFLQCCRGVCIHFHRIDSSQPPCWGSWVGGRGGSPPMVKRLHSRALSPEADPSAPGTCLPICRHASIPR